MGKDSKNTFNTKLSSKQFIKLFPSLSLWMVLYNIHTAYYGPFSVSNNNNNNNNTNTNTNNNNNNTKKNEGQLLLIGTFLKSKSRISITTDCCFSFNDGVFGGDVVEEMTNNKINK